MKLKKDDGLKIVKQIGFLHTQKTFSFKYNAVDFLPRRKSSTSVLILVGEGTEIVHESGYIVHQTKISLTTASRSCTVSTKSCTIRTIAFILLYAVILYI